MTPSGTMSGLWMKRFAFQQTSMFTAFRGGDGTPGNPDYQSGIRGQILPTVMCWPVDRSAVRAACCVRRRLIGVISLFIYNEVIPMFDPIIRASASWKPVHEYGRRGQTLDDIRQLLCRNHQGRSGSKRVSRLPMRQTANPVQGVRANVHCTMLVQPRLAWGVPDLATSRTGPLTRFGRPAEMPSHE